ncbi:MAG: Cna B-type domain-containing protein [Ruminococcus sp.]|nr:Cna B-type domain-containing protein [Ruminococcus sp.]
MKVVKSRILSLIVSLITVFSVFSMIVPSMCVKADENDKSLVLVCKNDDTVLVGVEWKLYLVGRRTTDSRNFEMIGDFINNQINMRNLSEERINMIAQTFQTYAVTENISPLQEASSDLNGEVTFSGLGAGLYLLTGKTHQVDYNYYVPTTMLLEVREDDTTVRHDAFPKFSYQVMSSEKRNYTVRKVWENDDPETRPSQIIVELYKDDEFERSVIISEETNWVYRWTDDDPSALWLVAEKYVPEGYEMRTDFNSQQYLIQNTYYDDAKPVPPDKNDYIMTTTDIHDTPSDSSTTTTTVATSDIDGGEGDKSRTTITGNVDSTEDNRTHTTTTADDNTGTNSTTIVTGSINGSEFENTTTTADGQRKPDNQESTSGGNSGSGNSQNSSSGGSSGGKLPQTGQLWWPVIPLATGGVLFISAGLVIRSRRRTEE